MRRAGSGQKGKRQRNERDDDDGEHGEEWLDDVEAARDGLPEEMAGWRKSIPLLYDWITNHHLVWPSLSCRWGPMLEDRKHKYTQRLYLSEQTDGTAPNTLLVMNVDVVKPRTAAADDITKFHYKHRSPFVKKVKAILHPGEVNRIRELAQDGNIVLTHTDSPEVYLWHVERQPGTSQGRVAEPDLVLTGHTQNAEFALATSRAAPMVISGGKDCNVLLWNVEDHVSGSLQRKGLIATTDSAKNKGEEKGGSATAANEGSKHGTEHSKEHKEEVILGETRRPAATRVAPRGVFRGHRATVEDVQFHPTEPTQFCSVGDDLQLLLWDARDPGSQGVAEEGTDAAAAIAAQGASTSAQEGGSTTSTHGPVLSVERAHERDVHCVDWNPANPNLLVTGSADRSARVFDIRKLKQLVGEVGPAEGAPGPHPNPGGRAKPKHLHTFRGAHSAPISCVQWCPDKATAFATSGEDGLVNVWDAALLPHRGTVREAKAEGVTPGLLFQHVGHRGRVTEFQWSPVEPWTFASVATYNKGGGHSFQMWRIMDLIFRPEREVLSELDHFLRPH